MLRAVVFDLDDTLLVDMGTVEAALSATAALVSERGIEEAALVESIRRCCRARWRGAPTGAMCQELGLASWEGLAADFTGGHESMRALEVWVPEYRLASWSDALAEHGIEEPSLAAALAETFRRERSTRHVLFGDALDTLRALRQQGLAIGLLTNGPPDMQRGKLRAAAIEDAFDAVVISGELGAGKPSPAAFEAVLAGLGVDAKDAVMVGDNPNRDVAGGHAAGMRTIWIDRWNTGPPDGLVADTAVHEAGEVPAVVEGWRS